ncbi:ribonuclease H-like domain-containing protein [Alkalihalobacillus sp. AL-G]|uniref:ribonuclease H-like domain-containing protein n=1 Tax=Alkalihalobacillus sp. AL-G TaxID=2926399 RepID=UPI002729FCAE|nr:ribonuclease H-like domain-containing protein [Alkalihalobacillus sp. AL-G]WLD91753.1 ribonuclease H-like domain-containing protein [Alkalihalobacillus sp. AL-G]
MSLQNKLNRFKKDITRTGAEKGDSAAIAKKPELLNRDAEKWSKFDVRSLSFEEESCMLREKRFASDTKLGHYTIQDYKIVIEKWNERQDRHPLSANQRTPEDLLFFDTETTGLGSGAGNTIFLLGMARVLGEGIQVRQYFLPSPGNEVALYHHFLSDVKEMKNLVTYNGKAFDWPQVKTRHTFVRDAVPKLPPFGHFDLLHGSRRVWKKSYESLRLSVVEKELLNIERKEDTPGYLAPMLYFEFLREKDPSILKGVFTHNELDVLTLISLYTHLSNILLDIGNTHLTSKEEFEVARWFEAVGDVDEAKRRYKALTKSTRPTEAMKALALLYRKEKEYDRAVALWEATLEQTKDVSTYIELSKAYEHRYKDLTKALYFAEQGYQQWKETSRISRGKEQRERVDFIKRIERLEHKII